jgi:hypothetical protein
MTRFSDPIALFDAAIDALNREDWLAAARLCDPVSLRSFHRNLLAQVAPAMPVPQLTAEDLMRSSPEMPREVAEFQVAEFRRHSDPGERLRSELPSVPSIAALRELSPAEAFAAHLDGRSFRRQIEHMAERGHLSPEVAARAAASAKGPLHRYVVLGAFEDGERIAHVLYRMRMDETAPWQGEMAAMVAALPDDEQTLMRDLTFRSHPHVATCRRQPDATWALLADHSFLGVGSTIISSVNVERLEPEGDVGGEDC